MNEVLTVAKPLTGKEAFGIWLITLATVAVIIVTAKFIQEVLFPLWDDHRTKARRAKARKGTMK